MDQTIADSIRHAYLGSNEQLRQQGQKFIDNAEQNDPKFLLTLCEIYKHAPQDIQLPLLILIKNVVMRCWQFYVLSANQKRILLIPSEVRDKVKERILQIYDSERVFQKQAEAALLAVCFFDFPFSYPLLMQYITNKITSQQIDLLFIKFLKRIYKRIPITQNTQKNLNAFWPQLNDFFNSIAFQINEQNLELHKQLDKLIVYYLHSFGFKAVQNIIPNFVISLLKKFASILQQPFDQYKKVLIKLLTKLQIKFPLSFSAMNDYLTLLLMQLQEPKKELRRAALIGLIQVLSNKSEYFQTSEMYQQILARQKKRPKNNSQPQEVNSYKVQQQNLIYTIVQSFFPAYFNQILELLLNLLAQKENEPIEEILEQEEEVDLQQLIDPYEAHISQLCIICSNRLITKFPLLGFNRIQQYLEQVVQLGEKINFPQFESLLQIIGQLPQISAKVKVPIPFQMTDLVQFLSTKESVDYQRRMAILANRVVLIISPEQMVEMIRLSIQLMSKSQDTIVQYQSLMCIRSVIQNYKQPLQWIEVLVLVVPYIVNFLNSFSRPTIVHQLLELLQLLVEKCQGESQESVTLAIEQSRLVELISAKLQQTEGNETLIDGLCDMLKTLIVVYPISKPPAHLFKLALQIIKDGIRSRKLQILQLFLFVLQEYQSHLYELDAVHQLYQGNRDFLLCDSDVNNQVVAILIAEEFVIRGLDRAHNYYIEVIQQVYPKKSLELKNACLNLCSSLILKQLEENVPLTGYLEIVKLLLKDFLSEQFYQKLETKFAIELQLTSILNRFIMSDGKGFVQFLESINVRADVYFSFWMKNIGFIQSSKAMRLNILALGSFLPFISGQCFMQYAEILKQHIQSALAKQVQQIKAQEFSIGMRLARFRTSSAKEQLRNSSLYLHIDLNQYFTAIWQKYLMEHNIKA